MKKNIAIVCSLFAFYGAFAGLFPKEWKDYSERRRICVKRDTQTLKGYCITHWERNGKPDWILPAVITNKVKVISGKRQNNPLQNRYEELKTLHETVKARLEGEVSELHAIRDKISEELNITKTRAERAEARHERMIAWLTEQRDSAKLATTKDIWQSVIDRISEERNND